MVIKYVVEIWMMSKSSTYRERTILAIAFNHVFWPFTLKDENEFLWNTDCAAAIVVKKGSNSLVLQNLATIVYNLCR